VRVLLHDHGLAAADFDLLDVGRQLEGVVETDALRVLRRT
jgi:hypothetical protein